MTIKEIAELCQVSVSTVSKVLHNDPGISAATREKVLAITKKYNFIPYSDVLRKALPDLKLVAAGFSDEEVYEKKLVYSLEKELFREGYNTILFNMSGEEKDTERYMNSFRDKGVRGYIWLHNKDRANTSYADIRVGTMGEKEQCVSYTIERSEFFESIMSYLKSRNHQNIGYLVSSKENAYFGDFDASYHHAFGRSPREEWKFSESGEKSTTLASKIVKSGITALICSNCDVGLMISHYLQQLGIQIPQQISIICIGDVPDTLHAKESLTRIYIDSAKLTRKLSSDLLIMLEKGEPLLIERVVPELILDDQGSVLDLKHQGPQMKTVVVGTVNIDVNLMVDELPETGETTHIRSSSNFSGGKGGNQAYGLGKAGMNVELLACIGDDIEGHLAYEQLRQAGVQMSGVSFIKDKPTGRAYVTIDNDGESIIMIHDGANAFMTETYIRDRESIFDGADYCLISSEISESVVRCTAEICRDKGIRLVMKPSAIDHMDYDLLKLIDYFVPNEKEAEVLMPGQMSVEERAAAFKTAGAKNVVITLGKDGCYLLNDQISRFYPAADFAAIDTTGACDAFISAMVAGLARGLDMDTTMDLANYAAGASVTQYGVQDSMVDWTAMYTYLENAQAHRLQS